jgi:flavin-dependent dehydrogenase
MNGFEGKLYDVAIMGGGPAGATLAARLARETELRVAVFEAERFPREHIGESLVHSIVPILQESGALEKVLASDCWIKKFGGYFAWSDRPWASYFEHAANQKDGLFRWSIHCNRPEFDQILLDHARESGAEVYQGTPVTAVVREDGVTRLTLGERGEARARLFVNCSGRTGSTTITGERAFLSKYRNIAIWGHIVDGLPAQSLKADWNIFHEKNVSPIGCFALENGWFWFIPVPRVVNGRRVRTHSLGLVTDPAILQRPGCQFTEPEAFLKAARSTRFLKDLVKDARLVSPELHTATNYSRISGRMCDYDSGEIRVGDAAYFVDPLFSSGVHFALIHASMAAVLIRATLVDALPEPLARDLWEDYDGMLRTAARGFALGIDQWYHEIARDNPGSVYWRERGEQPTFAAREETFRALVNGSVGGDLMHIISKGTNSIGLLGEEGALRRTHALLAGKEPAPAAKVRLKRNVRLQPSVTLEAPALVDGKPSPFAHGRFWDDPRARAGEVRRIFPGPTPCHRFSFADGENESRVRFLEPEHKGAELHARLSRGGQAYGALKESLSPAQRHLLLHLAVSEMLETN